MYSPTSEISFQKYFNFSFLKVSKKYYYISFLPEKLKKHENADTVFLPKLSAHPRISAPSNKPPTHPHHTYHPHHHHYHHHHHHHHPELYNQKVHGYVIYALKLTMLIRNPGFQPTWKTWKSGNYQGIFFND
jgi:hypothetical protein